MKVDYNMKKNCELCDTPISEVGRISKFNVLFGRKTTKFGNDMMMFRELWLCKKCIEKQKKKNLIIFNTKGEKNVDGN